MRFPASGDLDYVRCFDVFVVVVVVVVFGVFLSVCLFVLIFRSH